MAEFCPIKHYSQVPIHSFFQHPPSYRSLKKLQLSVLSCSPQAKQDCRAWFSYYCCPSRSHVKLLKTLLCLMSLHGFTLGTLFTYTQCILIWLHSPSSLNEKGKMFNSISNTRWLCEAAAKIYIWQALRIRSLFQTIFINFTWCKKYIWPEKDTPALVLPSLSEQILKVCHVPFRILWNHPWYTAHLSAEKYIQLTATKKAKKGSS